MRADMNHDGVQTFPRMARLRSSWNRPRRLLCGVSGAALTTACLLSSPVQAKTYLVGNAIEFSDAIAAANADGDPSATILLTNSFTTTVVFTANKPITIDTGGFVLGGPSFSGQSFTLSGNIVYAGGLGLSIVSDGLLTNNGTITGSAGFAAAAVNSRATLVNNGTVTGGARINTQGGTIINNGLMQGSAGATPGRGVIIQINSGSAVLTNNSTGTVRGGTSADGTTGASAIQIAGLRTNTITNLGLIEGGVGAVAIEAGAFGNTVTVVNGGTIRAGAGGANAIAFSTNAASINTLELQDGSQIIGNVIASAAGVNDTLRLSGSGGNSLDISQYQNFDTLEKAGTGTWTVTGSGSVAGPTDILGGKLVVNGSLAGSAVTVASGGTLGGSGAVGATSIAAGGAIAPGNSIGTLTVNGAYSQAAGATYQVEVDPATVTSDLIKVNGTATLASGAGLSVVNYTGAAYTAGQRYTILTSTGLIGNYGASDIAIGPMLSLRNSTDATNAYLSVVQTGTAAGVGGTGNEIGVGNAVDSLPGGNAVQSGVYNQPSIDAARRTLNQLSGEIHASAKTALIEESRLLGTAMNDRLRSAFGSVGAATLDYGYTADLAPTTRGPMPLPQAERFAVWGQGYGSWGRSAGDGNAATLKRSTGGFLLGADAAVFDNLRFGIVAGYSRSDFDVANRFSMGESDNYHLGVYGGGQWGALNLRAGASYSWHDVETRRTVTSAFIGSAPRANYDAGTGQLFGEIGYRVDLGHAAFEPFAGLAYVHLNTDDFNETGAVTALQGWGDSSGIGYSTLGLRASTDLDMGGMAVKLRGGLAWRHAFGDTNPKATLAFAGSSAFTVAGLPIARDAALVEAGLDVGIGRGATLGLAYTGQLAEDAQDHAFKGVLAVRF